MGKHISGKAAVVPALVMCLGVLHVLLGMASVSIGIVSSASADVWLAHSVSPIWSGAFFIITGVLGIVSGKNKSVYLSMCFVAFCVVSVVTAVVSIQLLRLGLISQTSDGDTFRKNTLDVNIVVGLGAAGVEVLLCLVSGAVGVLLLQVARAEHSRRGEGTFSVQVVSQKDVLVVSGQTGKTEEVLAL